jgi:hypothetical protein
VFLQSDVLDASVSMRDTFEEYAADAFTLAPEHRPDNVFFLGDATAPASSPSQHRQHDSPPGSDTGSSDEGATGHMADNGEGSSSSSSMPSSSSSSDGGAGVDEGDRGSGVAASSSPAAASGSDGSDVGGEGEERFESQWKKGGWLRENPMGVPTEREYLVGSEGRSVYRVLLTKVASGAS